MLFHRNPSVHALVVAAPVAGLGIPITTPGTTPSRQSSLSETIYHHFHGEQYHQYRKVCYRLAFMAKSLRETAGILGALGSPIRLTCGIALSLVEALEGMVVNRQMCSDLAELVTRHLNMIREELGGAANGDAKFRSLVEDYAETLRSVSQGVALIAHRRRLSQLVHHHSESEELLRFKNKLDDSFQALMLQCGLQTRQMQGHVVTDQRHIIENQNEHSRIMVSLNEKLECILDRIHIMENRSNLDQFLHTLTGCFDDSRLISMHSPASDLIDLPKPTIPRAIPVFVKA